MQVIRQYDLKPREITDSRNRSTGDPDNGAIRCGLKNSFAKYV